MNALNSRIAELKDNLESAAFLVSKGASEKEVHKALVQSLVFIEQIEAEVKDLVKTDETTAGRPKYHGSDKIGREIEKVKRKTPGWFRKPSQKNSIILINFLRLAEQYSEVTPSMLRRKCEADKNFTGNYNQMKNFGEKNHGKVFEEKNGVIELWEPVKQYILDLYSECRKDCTAQ